jgi:hypothetical protein
MGGLERFGFIYSDCQLGYNRCRRAQKGHNESLVNVFALIMAVVVDASEKPEQLVCHFLPISKFGPFLCHLGSN